MKVKDYRMLIKKKPKYRARITKACPDCWNELFEVEDLPGTYKCTYCMNVRWDKKDEIVTFHSKDEQLRGSRLKAMEKKGYITGLGRQKRYNLHMRIAQYKLKGFNKWNVGCIEPTQGFPGTYRFDQWPRVDVDTYVNAKECSEIITFFPMSWYVLDFHYFNVTTDSWIYEDFKGYQTKGSEKKIELYEKLYRRKVTITTREDLK